MPAKYEKITVPVDISVSLHDIGILPGLVHWAGNIRFIGFLKRNSRNLNQSQEQRKRTGLFCAG
jgi:hypothetical protein